MSREIVFDIETQNTFADVNNDIKGLKVSVVVIYDYSDDQYKVFKEDELGELWPILEQADRLIGYNSIHFDVPVLNNYYPGNLLDFPQLDMLKRIKESLGNRLRLNDVATATLKVKKSGDGLEAVKWYAEGNWDDLIKYCTDDVKITKEVYEFGKKNKQLFYPDLMSGEIRPFPVNFDPPPEAAETPKNVNLSLPF